MSDLIENLPLLECQFWLEGVERKLSKFAVSGVFDGVEQSRSESYKKSLGVERGRLFKRIRQVIDTDGDCRKDAHNFVRAMRDLAKENNVIAQYRDEIESILKRGSVRPNLNESYPIDSLRLIEARIRLESIERRLSVLALTGKLDGSDENITARKNALAEEKSKILFRIRFLRETEGDVRKQTFEFVGKMRTLASQCEALATYVDQMDSIIRRSCLRKKESKGNQNERG